MSIYEALVTRLGDNAALTALIGTRLYPDEVPQETTFPAVFYMTVSDIKDHFLTNQSPLESPNIQFTVYAHTRKSAEQVAEAIKTALVDYQGSMSGVPVHWVRLVDEQPMLYTMPRAGLEGTVTIHTHDLEFEVHFIKE